MLHPGNAPVYAGKKHGLPTAGSDLSDSADREDVPRQPGLFSSANPSVLYHGKKLFLQPKGVMVMLEAEHTCMTMRGIKKPGSKTMTVITRGEFKNNIELQKQFLAMVKD